MPPFLGTLRWYDRITEQKHGCSLSIHVAPQFCNIPHFFLLNLHIYLCRRDLDSFNIMQSSHSHTPLWKPNFILLLKCELTHIIYTFLYSRNIQDYSCKFLEYSWTNHPTQPTSAAAATFYLATTLWRYFPRMRFVDPPLYQKCTKKISHYFG